MDIIDTARFATGICEGFRPYDIEGRFVHFVRKYVNANIDCFVKQAYCITGKRIFCIMQDEEDKLLIQPVELKGKAKHTLVSWKPILMPPWKDDINDYL